MCREYEGSYADPKFRDGCDFVPFTESKLAKIVATNLREGRQWSLSATISPNLLELCARYREAMVVAEPTREETAVAELPPVAESLVIEQDPLVEVGENFWLKDLLMLNSISGLFV